MKKYSQDKNGLSSSGKFLSQKKASAGMNKSPIVVTNSSKQRMVTEKVSKFQEEPNVIRKSLGKNKSSASIPGGVLTT